MDADTVKTIESELLAVIAGNQEAGAADMEIATALVLAFPKMAPKILESMEFTHAGVRSVISGKPA